MKKMERLDERLFEALPAAEATMVASGQLTPQNTLWVSQARATNSPDGSTDYAIDYF